MSLLNELTKEDMQKVVKGASKYKEERLKYKYIYDFMLDNFCNFEPDSPYDYLNSQLKNFDNTEIERVSALSSKQLLESITSYETAERLKSLEILFYFKHFDENVAKLNEAHIQLMETRKSQTNKKYIGTSQQIADTYAKLCKLCRLPCYVCEGEKPTLYGIKQKYFNAFSLKGHIRFADITTDLNIFENPEGTPRTSNDVPRGSYFNRSLNEMVVMDGYKGRKISDQDKQFLLPLNKSSHSIFETSALTDKEYAFFKNNFERNIKIFKQPLSYVQTNASLTK